LPGKNVRPVAGMPLYLHAVQQGLRTTGRVVISTDIQNILDSEPISGCLVSPRPAELATDDTPMAPVISDLIARNDLQNSTLVLLQATSPLRSDSDIVDAIMLFEAGGHDLVMSVVERDRGVLKYGTLHGDSFVAMRDPAFSFQNRQSLPEVYGPNGAVYVFSGAKFMEAGNFPTARIGAVKMPVDRSVDVDNEQDFQRVEALMASRGGEAGLSE
jgi:N-acylneuraminate cytidylyltransferase